ncbi:MAG: hypothetical protein M1819_003015 [Sarea resinae]|nr:MAG: hypothetical protein M1819_003015 [Sarea resinae]
MDTYQLPQKLPFSKKRLPKRVIVSYIADYVIIIVLAVLITVLDTIEPFHQPFSLRNYTLQYPYAVHERVSTPLLIVISIAAPIIIIAVYTLLIDGLFSSHRVSSSNDRGRTLGKYRLKDRLWELNCGVLGLLLSSGAAYVITGALKNATGKPRPDIIARCRPKVALDPQPFGLSNYTICAQTDKAMLKDGFKSFPSGHSSTAFSGLFFLSLYLAGKLHVMDTRGEVWKTFVVLVPALGAALIADSRIMDARHHPFDVLSGSLLGIVVAWCAYRQYFPPVTEPWKKGRAYPIRSWGKDPLPPNEPSNANLYPEPSVEPLRPTDAAAARDEEQVPHPDDLTPGTNVFRLQVTESQRRRQQTGDVSRSSSYYTNPGNPFSSTVSAVSGSQRRAPSRQDGYWSSSSDDEDERFELQRQYTLSHPRDEELYRTDGLGAGSGTAGAGAVDTAYRPQQTQPQTSAPAYEAYGPSMGVREPQPTHTRADVVSPITSPPIGGGAREAAGQRRGVELVETYTE